MVLVYPDLCTSRVPAGINGLGGRLTGFSPDRAKDPVKPAGLSLENFVISEIARQLSWSE